MIKSHEAIGKFIKSTMLIFGFWFFIQLTSFSAIEYPDYFGKNVVDMSGKFDSTYLATLEAETKAYDYEMRIVFLNTNGKINLAFYAPKLFENWKMDEDSVLVAIDPYLNKFGYAVGKKVREQLRKNRIENNSKEANSLNEKKEIDYDNLTQAINQKFSGVIVKDNKKNSSNSKSNLTSKASNPYKYSQGNTTKETNYSNNNLNIEKKYIFAVILLGLILGAGYYFIAKNLKTKKLIEKKTNFSFDTEILSKELNTLIEKIASDIEKMGKYQGNTKLALETHIEKLKKDIVEGTDFIEELNTLLDEVELDEIMTLKYKLDDGNTLFLMLQQNHKDSVKIRKEFKSVLESVSMTVSDVRVNIENCNTLLEESKILYPFSLSKLDIKLLDIQKSIPNVDDPTLKNDPIKFKEEIQELHKKLNSLKKELSIIPHLYKQLQEDIPLNISSYLDESLLDASTKSKIQNEVNQYKNNALISLSEGDLPEAELLVKKIFENITHAKV